MDKHYVLALIADNDLVVKAPFVAKYNVQFLCKV